MQHRHCVILAFIVSTALACPAAIVNWCFYPPGVPPSGLPALADDSTNIALDGWADAQVDSNAPAFPFGLDEAGHAESQDSSRGEACLLFNLSNVYAVVSDSYVNATLHLYLLGAADTMPVLTVSVARSLGSWAQDSVTWDTKPGGGASSYGFTGVQDLNTNIAIDVTSVMNAELGDLPANRHGFMLLDSSGASPCFFSSESAVADYRPYLHVVVPEPAPLSLVSLACLLIGVRRTASAKNVCFRNHTMVTP